jgi:hypothetical protein
MKVAIHALTLVGFAQLLFLTMPAYPYGSRENSVRDVHGFNVISLETAGRLFLIQGDEEYLSIDAPPDVVRRIITKVDGDTLHIRYQGIFTGRKTVPIFKLGMKSVRNVIASSAGDIEADGIEAEELALDASSSGNIVIGSLSARKVQVRIRSSGSVEIGDGRLTTLDAKLTSSGNLRIAGKAQSMALNVLSSGDVKGDNFQISSAAVTLSSSGDAVIWVMDRLDAKLSGKGKLAYWGEPKLDEGAAYGADKMISLGVK